VSAPASGGADTSCEHRLLPWLPSRGHADQLLPPPVNSPIFLAPLILLGFSAGALRVWAGLPSHTPTRRRLLQFGWVALLLIGTPVWLVLSAVLKLW
jgi:hypothetical protein